MEVSFDKSNYTYSENHGIVNDMNLELNTSIAQNLTIGIKGMYIKTLLYIMEMTGAPSNQPSTVVKSDIAFNVDVTFTAGGSLTTSVPVNIRNDTTALETAEYYNYTITSSSITKNVVLGGSAVFEILDDDGMIFVILYCLYLKQLLEFHLIIQNIHIKKMQEVLVVSL